MKQGSKVLGNQSALSCVFIKCVVAQWDRRISPKRFVLSV